MIDKRPHVVVLAGGEGKRLGPLTRALYGSELPKQFAVLAGERSLLQATVERARMLTSTDRISVVVPATYAELARTQLAEFPELEVIPQPRNLDTGPGMLLPLIRILRRDAAARVVFLPSDHHVPCTEPLVAAIRETALREITLIGVAAMDPEVEYGWIVRGQQIGRTNAFEAREFHEKPPLAIADRLWRTGGLWNTFISIAPATEYWMLVRRHLPVHAAAFEHYGRSLGGRDEAHALASLYGRLEAANFSRDVLAHAGHLAVVPVSGTGWSDWGSPERVLHSLHGTPAHEALLARLRSGRSGGSKRNDRKRTAPRA